MDKKCVPSTAIICCDTDSVLGKNQFTTVTVQNIAERNEIPCKLRKDGMIAIVREENYFQYQLRPGPESGLCNNGSWVLMQTSDEVYVAGKDEMLVRLEREEKEVLQVQKDHQAQWVQEVVQEV